MTALLRLECYIPQAAGDEPVILPRNSTDAMDLHEMSLACPAMWRVIVIENTMEVLQLKVTHRVANVLGHIHS